MKARVPGGKNSSERPKCLDFFHVVTYYRLAEALIEPTPHVPCDMGYSLLNCNLLAEVSLPSTNAHTPV